AAICSEADRCKVCSVASALVPNFIKKAQSNHSTRMLRDLEGHQRRLPPKGVWSRCGNPVEDHDDRECARTVKRPRRAGVKFAERVAARDYTDTLVAQRLEERFRESTESGHESPLPSGVSLDSHHYLGVSSFSYGGEETGVVLSRESARDLLRPGHLGLGMRSARELCKILRRDGVYFPEGGLKKALDEKWDMDRHCEATSTPFVFCTDINALLNIVTGGESHRITRLKLQFDGGQQFLKLSIDITTMEEGSRYMPSPNSVLKNFVIGMGQASETQKNLEQVLGHSSVKALFHLDIPKQVACDFKVSAMMVGIQMASCNSHTIRVTRTWKQHMKDLESASHNVVAQPVIQWVNSPLYHSEVYLADKAAYMGGQDGGIQSADKEVILAAGPE
ncbi:hypothetical protein FOZ62_029401, partial [Perkinsus olseni]